MAGTDAAIIDTDCNLDKAAEAVLWGAMSNAGQTCVGIERAYVHKDVADVFIQKISERASHLVAGQNYGAITMPSQLAVIDSHIKDAVNHGAHFIAGSVNSVQPPYVLPTILIDTQKIVWPLLKKLLAQR